MKRQNKILLANMLTGFAALATFICLFAMNGVSVQTVIALFAAAGCAYLTTCFFKVENILRKQRAQAILNQRRARASISVVNGANKPKVA